MDHLCCTWDGPPPRTVNAVRIWPPKAIVFKFPVLKNSRPRNGSFMVVSLANPMVQLHWLLEKKQTTNQNNPQLWYSCANAWKSNKCDEASSEKLQVTFLSIYTFQAFCYAKLRVIPLAALVHTVFLSVQTRMFFPLIYFYCNAFFWVKMLEKAEPKPGHILRISIEITHITFRKFKDLIKIILLVLPPELFSFCTLCRRGQ